VTADLGTQKLAFFETLVEILAVKSVSDRTCFRRVADWLAQGVRDGRFGPDVFATALLYAREATIGPARNRNAVFMSVLRKELGHGR
jgi:hypothetical protein